MGPTWSIPSPWTRPLPFGPPSSHPMCGSSCTEETSTYDSWTGIWTCTRSTCSTPRPRPPFSERPLWDSLHSWRTYFDVRLSKKYQRADWAQRPLSTEMLEYAASDTQYLHALADLLGERLETLGRLAWAEEESTLMESIRWSEDGKTDPVTRVKKARYLDLRDVALLREAWLWRDEIARKRDRAPFRVAADPVLLEIVATRPGDVAALAATSGFSPQLAERSGKALLTRLEQVDRMEDADLLGYPRTARSGPGRPPPEVEEVAERLKVVRNRCSDELGIARGTLASNTVLLEIARAGPQNATELLAVQGVRRWQVEALGDALVQALTDGAPPA